MKPFTLKWWMDKLDLVTVRYYVELHHFDSSKKNYSVNNHHRRMCVKYLNLQGFIFDRIITKYGESE